MQGTGTVEIDMINLTNKNNDDVVGVHSYLEKMYMRVCGIMIPIDCNVIHVVSADNVSREVDKSKDDEVYVRAYLGKMYMSVCGSMQLVACNVADAASFVNATHVMDSSKDGVAGVQAYLGKTYMRVCGGMTIIELNVTDVASVATKYVSELLTIVQCRLAVGGRLVERVTNSGGFLYTDALKGLFMDEREKGHIGNLRSFCESTGILVYVPRAKGSPTGSL